MASVAPALNIMKEREGIGDSTWRQDKNCLAFCCRCCCYNFLATPNLLSGLAHCLFTPLFIVLSDSVFRSHVWWTLQCMASFQVICFTACFLLLQAWELGTWCNDSAHSSCQPGFCFLCDVISCLFAANRFQIFAMFASKHSLLHKAFPSLKASTLRSFDLRVLDRRDIPVSAECLLLE